MIGYKWLRSVFGGRLEEARRAPNDTRAYARARADALREVFDVMGLAADDFGNPLVEVDERGLPVLGDGRAGTREFSFASLGEAIFGLERFREIYHPASGLNFDGGLEPYIREAAIGPETFVDINTFNLSIAGLINAEIMERFAHPKYIGKDLVTVKPTKMNGQKLIGISPVRPQTAAAKARFAGEMHAEVGLGAAYQTTPETVEQALKIKVTREAAFFDLTGDVLDAAGEGIGDELGYGMEKDIADGVMGVTSSYNRNGTAYATYQTTSPYINDLANPFSDETDIDDARQLFVGMTDPETGREIQVDGRTILCMPGRELKFRDQLFAPNVQVGTQAAGNFPSRWKMTSSQINAVGAGGAYTIVSLSSIWYNRATAATGLNLSASDAKEYWWVGDFPQAFFWMENWPLTPWQANADELAMKDQGLIAVYGCNYRGVMYSREPRRAVRCKAS